MTGDDEPCYVIAGLGFSAILNHLLLTKTDFGIKRVGKLPIIHIGETDPWATYDIERMGQWPALLHLPGFADYLSTEPAREFLRCMVFATANESELSLLEANGRSSVLHGKITRVESRADKKFYVKVDATYPMRTGRNLVAEKIDICTGLGPPKMFAKERIKNRELENEYFDPWTHTERRLLMGDVALHRDIPLSGRICVCGGGPTGAWCVERAMAISGISEVVWVLRTLGDPFPASGRNDHLVQSVTRNSWQVDTSKDVLPRAPKLRIACGYEMEGLDLTEDGRVNATFMELQGAKQRFYFDSKGTSLMPLERGDFDQVVLALGYGSELPEFLGHTNPSWFPIVRPGGSSLDEIDRPDSLNCGFSDRKDQVEAQIRLLGPASRALANTSPQASRAFLANLPRQTDKSWIPVEALHIAWANGLFGPSLPNQNINTADELDLARLGVDQRTASQFCVNRGSTVDPFISGSTPEKLWQLSCGYAKL